MSAAREGNAAGPLLVVEDSDEDFDTVLQAAKKAGLTNEVRRATTGDECLALLRGSGGPIVRPALVLLDLNLPGTDGREALCQIRADARLRGLTVVVLSTSANPRDVNSCYRLGANAYHVKPVRHQDHLRVLLDLFAYWLTRVTLPEPESYTL